jgi:prevent-host-death family protein
MEPTPATELRRHLASILGRVRAGERVVISVYGKPLAAVVPLADAELVEAIEAFITARGQRTDDSADAAVWAELLDLQELTL